MDWPADHSPFLTPEDIAEFDCSRTGRPMAHCRVFYMYNSDTSIREMVLKQPSDWDTFMDSAIFSGGQPGQTPETQRPPPRDLSGICLFMVPRTKRDDEGEINALWELPVVDEESWARIARAFRVSGIFSRNTMCKRDANVSSVVCRDPGEQHQPRQQPLQHQQPGTTAAQGQGQGQGQQGESLWMHMAVTSAQWANWDNMALASTHLEQQRLTTAVLLGTTKRQIDNVRRLLGNALAAESGQAALRHPLLMLGMAAELMLERLRSIVESNRKSCRWTKNKLETEADRIANGPSHMAISKKGMEQVKDRQVWSKRIEDEILTTKRHLERTIKRCGIDVNGGDADDLSIGGNGCSGNGNGGGGGGGTPATEAGDDDAACRRRLDKRFKQRFEDVLVELEDLLARNKLSVEDMSHEAELLRDAVAQDEASTSGRVAEASKTLAYVAMFYLPVSTLATIFAMPVFKFEYEWRDIHWHLTSSSKDEPPPTNGTTDVATPGGAADGPGTPPPPVVSQYFWYYLILTTLCTILTMCICQYLVSHPFRWSNVFGKLGIKAGADKSHRDSLYPDGEDPNNGSPPEEPESDTETTAATMTPAATTPTTATTTTTTTGTAATSPATGNPLRHQGQVQQQQQPQPPQRSTSPGGSPLLQQAPAHTVGSTGSTGSRRSVRQHPIAPVFAATAAAAATPAMRATPPSPSPPPRNVSTTQAFAEQQQQQQQQPLAGGGGRTRRGSSARSSPNLAPQLLKHVSEEEEPPNSPAPPPAGQQPSSSSAPSQPPQQPSSSSAAGAAVSEQQQQP
ncbi:hypothetical protein RB598_005527 [Gaeumannomyces tritici]